MRAATRAVVGFLLLGLAGACAGQTNQEFDMRLREMAGSNERALLGSMGRIPDNSYQIGDQTKVLQWLWWDTSYGSPSCSPRRGRGGYSSTLSDGCRVEWTVSKGTSQWYHWEGYGCRSDTVIFPVH